jgi:small subunit ribosomal protein S18
MPAKKTTKKRRTNRDLRPVPVNCPFCKEHTQPDYKNFEVLQKYITDRAKILPKTRSGICSKHQRRLAIEIKRARIIALLPFVGSL